MVWLICSLRVILTDLVSSGKGLCHSEKSVMEGINGAMQTIVRIPRDKLHILPQISRIAANDLPIIPLEGILI